jgi:DNA-binding transcriptional ArsR family regulator
MALAAELHLLMFARQQHFAGYGEAEEALLRALNGLATPFGQDWEALLPREQLAVARIAHGARVFAGLSANDSEAVRRALNRLREDGLVVKEGEGRYRLREPLFAAYLRRTVALP